MLIHEKRKHDKADRAIATQAHRKEVMAQAKLEREKREAAAATQSSLMGGNSMAHDGEELLGANMADELMKSFSKRSGRKLSDEELRQECAGTEIVDNGDEQYVAEADDSVAEWQSSEQADEEEDGDEISGDEDDEHDEDPHLDDTVWHHQK